MWFRILERRPADGFDPAPGTAILARAGGKNPPDSHLTSLHQGAWKYIFPARGGISLYIRCREAVAEKQTVAFHKGGFMRCKRELTY
jgi:hypothetical protein